MKRLLPWLMGVGLAGAGCSPKSDVAPGAPQLTLMTIVESSGITDIDGKESDCDTTAQDGAVCDPKAATLCRSITSWCRCLPTDAMDATKPSNWSCLFQPTSMVIATFDRLLDTQPLDYDPDTQPGRTDVASFAATKGMKPEALVQYVSNGSETALIFKLLTNVIHGPRLLVAGSPALPSGSSLTLSLDKAKIRAKDHTSLFTSSGLIKDGVLKFATAPLSASIDVPVAPPPDTDAAVSTDVDGGADDDAGEAGTDATNDATNDTTADASTDANAEAGAAPAPLPAPVMDGSQPVTITFNNVTGLDQIKSALTVTASGTAFTAFDFTVSKMNPLAYVLTPATNPMTMMPDPWPAGAVIVITVDASAADVQGVALGAPVTATFVTEP